MTLTVDDFLGKPQIQKFVEIPLSNLSNKVIALKPEREWKTDGEVRDDGTVKYMQSNEFKYVDEARTRAYFIAEIILSDKNGFSTDGSAPIEICKLELEVDEAKKLFDFINAGETIMCDNLRIELRTSTSTSGSFTRVVTKPVFVCDGLIKK